MRERGVREIKLTFEYIGINQNKRVNCQTVDMPVVDKCQPYLEYQCTTTPPKNPFSKSIVVVNYEGVLCTGTEISYTFGQIEVYFL